MKIIFDSIIIERDAANKEVLLFRANDGSFWKYDQKKIFRQLFPSFNDVQEEFTAFLNRHYPDRVERTHKLDKYESDPFGKSHGDHE